MKGSQSDLCFLLFMVIVAASCKGVLCPAVVGV